MIYFVLEVFFFLIIGFVGIFFLWSRLREDFSEDLIFSLGLSIFGLAFIFLLLSYFYKDALFWSIVVGIGFSAYFQSKKKKVRFFEIVDILTISTLWSFFARASVLLGFKRDLTELLNFIFIIFLIFLYYSISGSYKKFTWYRSGRVGIAGIITLAFFFLGRSLVAIFAPNMLSLKPNWEIILSLSFLPFLVFGFYKLSKV